MGSDNDVCNVANLVGGRFGVGLIYAFLYE